MLQTRTISEEQTSESILPPEMQKMVSILPPEMQKIVDERGFYLYEWVSFREYLNIGWFLLGKIVKKLSVLKLIVFMIIIIISSDFLKKSGLNDMYDVLLIISIIWIVFTYGLYYSHLKYSRVICLKKYFILNKEISPYGSISPSLYNKIAELNSILDKPLFYPPIKKSFIDILYATIVWIFELNNLGIKFLLSCHQLPSAILISDRQ